MRIFDLRQSIRSQGSQRSNFLDVYQDAIDCRGD